MDLSEGSTFDKMTTGVVTFDASAGVVTIKRSNLMLNGFLLIIAICVIMLSVIGLSISKQDIGKAGSVMLFILGSLLAYLSYAGIIQEIELIRKEP